MFHVYILRGASGRHYIGQTSDLPARLAQHLGGHTHTTRRLGGNVQLLASRAFATRAEAANAERMLKSWKNPAKALAWLQAGQP
ncbi:MAG TPA: GIY-YIG nuclease family protein [Lacunisphaera sp.]|nr:GIY-YIG nuclease family protein [Lacunisphaera sp.]